MFSPQVLHLFVMTFTQSDSFILHILHSTFCFQNCPHILKVFSFTYFCFHHSLFVCSQSSFPDMSVFPAFWRLHPVLQQTQTLYLSVLNKFKFWQISFKSDTSKAIVTQFSYVLRSEFRMLLLLPSGIKSTFQTYKSSVMLGIIS